MNRIRIHREAPKSKPIEVDYHQVRVDNASGAFVVIRDELAVLFVRDWTHAEHIQVDEDHDGKARIVPIAGGIQ